MRITPELIDNSYQYTNKSTTDRELRLRALKITAIENLGATMNQFDCIDFSDNNIRKLENFPFLPRIKCLLLSNNRVYKIRAHLEESIPNLERLILTNNYVQNLGDIDTLVTLPNLTTLSLVNNPITTKPHYRHYVIHKLPGLKLLDFNKVTRREREASAKFFSGSEGDLLARSIGIKTKATDDEARSNMDREEDEYRKRRKIEEAQMAEQDAVGLRSINRINNLLKSGYVPGSRRKQDDLIENLDLGTGDRPDARK